MVTSISLYFPMMVLLCQIIENLTAQSTAENLKWKIKKELLQYHAECKMPSTRSLWKWWSKLAISDKWWKYMERNCLFILYLFIYYSITVSFIHRQHCEVWKVYIGEDTQCSNVPPILSVTLYLRSLSGDNLESRILNWTWTMSSHCIQVCEIS